VPISSLIAVEEFSSVFVSSSLQPFSGMSSDLFVLVLNSQYLDLVGEIILMMLWKFWRAISYKNSLVTVCNVALVLHILCLHNNLYPRFIYLPESTKHTVYIGGS
jgi:hypothetical protein